MARTLPVYELDATSGKTALYLVDPLTPNDRGPFLSPNANPEAILFHSDQTFMQVAYDEQRTITFQDMTGRFGHDKEHAFPNHGLGYIPHAMAVVNGNVMISGQPIQIGGGTRTLFLTVTASGVSIREKVVKWWQDSMPAITRTIRIVILGRMVPTLSNSFEINCATGLVQFGYGKIRNNGPDLVKGVKSGASQFLIPKPGPSLDTTGAGLRHVSPDGTRVSYLYSGTFTGSGGWPVKV